MNIPRTVIIRNVVTLILAVGLLLAACGAAPVTRESRSEAPAAPPAAPMESAGGSVSNIADVSESGDQAANRLVIKNADLQIVVASPQESMDRIGKMAEEMEGFIVSSKLDHRTLDSGVQVPEGSITIRVPAERLNEAVAKIEAESDRDPLSRDISSQDVTKDYTDLQSRLKNLENTEAQLTNIMDSATKTEDVLSVYNQLVQVREQIEVIKGQIQYYEQSAALSAISVSLVANETVQPLTIGSWQPQGVAKNAVQALINSLKFIANAAIWLVIFVAPVLLVLFVVFFLPLRLLWRAVYKRTRRHPPVAPAPPSEPAAS